MSHATTEQGGFLTVKLDSKHLQSEVRYAFKKSHLGESIIKSVT